MNGKQLKNSILQWAIQGKLVSQDPNDEPASVLLEKIRGEKERLIKEKKIKRDKNASIIYRGEDNSYYEKILATGKVKCIDEEIPFEVPQGWEWCKINNIAFVTKLAGFEYTKYIAGNLKTNGIPLFKGKNVQGGKIIYEFEAYIPESLSDELERSQISKKCLLTPYVGTIGNIGLHNKSGKFHLGSNVGKIEILNPASQVCILEEFVHIYLLSQYGYAELTKYKKATAQESISIEAIRDVLLPIPPTQEQQKIVDKYYQLETFADKYSKLQGCLDKLNTEIFDKFKKSVLQEAIQGKLVPQIASEGTANELLEQIKIEKQELVKEGKLKKSALNDSVIFKGDDNKYYEQIGKKSLDITEQIPFEIPSNWEWCRVRNVSNSYIGLTYKLTDIDEKGTIVLRSCNIRNGKLALDDIVRVSSSISEKLLIEENDIIICARNGSKRLVGKSALIRNLPEPMTFGAFMAICKTPIYEYMFAYLQSDLFFGQLRDVSNTTTINQLTQNKFNDFLIPIPPIREQERIAFKISQLFQKLR